MRTRAGTAALVLIASALIAASPADEMFAVLHQSVDDWNRGDLDAFVGCYEQSPETTFVGMEISKGVDGVLARYKRSYPDKEHMGRTTFSDLRARPLTPTLAIVTGRFTLDRKPEFGGRRTGVFTLVMRKGPVGWRIIHDHSSATN